MRGIGLWHHEDTMMRGLRGFYPKSIAHHVGFGNILQRLGGAGVDISACH